MQREAAITQTIPQWLMHRVSRTSPFSQSSPFVFWLLQYVSVDAEASSSCVSDRWSGIACGAEGSRHNRTAQHILCAELTDEDEINSLFSDTSFAPHGRF